MEETGMHRHGWHRRMRQGRGQGFGRVRDVGGGLRRFFRPGELRLALLSLLSDGPQHGYELMRQLESRSAASTARAPGPSTRPFSSWRTRLARSEAVDGKRVTGSPPKARPSAPGGRRDRPHLAARERWDEWSGLTGPDVWELARPVRLLARAVLRARRADGESKDRRGAPDPRARAPRSRAPRRPRSRADEA
jgi:hypothetical protein